MQPKDFLPAQTDNKDKGFETEADYDQYQPTPFSKRQKIAVAVLAIFGILVIVFWAVQFKTSLKNSLKHSSSTNTESSGANEDVVANENNKSNEILKTKDSDSDGLSDWDELNTYKTSPYLEDSDSDGYLDKKEIETDNDPNCPMGQVCVVASDAEETVPEPTADSTSQTMNNVLGTSATTDSSVSFNSSPNSGNIDAATLRKLLLQGGIDQSMLDNTSDADLLKIYQESLEESSNN